MNCNLAFINWFNTNQGFLMALLTAVYVVATILLVRHSNRANRIAQQNLDSLWKLERERTRPHVVIYFEIDLPIVSIAVSNIGQTSAFDIRFDMPQKPTFAIPERKGEPIHFLNSAITSLAPQQTLKTVVGKWPEIRNVWPTFAFSGTVAYKTLDGTEHVESFSVDLADQEGLTYSTKKGLHEIAEAIEYLGKTPSAKRVSWMLPPKPLYTTPEKQSP